MRDELFDRFEGPIHAITISYDYRLGRASSSL